MKLLDRYLLRQLPVPFLAGALLLLVLYFADHARGLGEIVAGGNVPMGVVARYLALRVPGVVVLCIPAGLLLATAIVVNRLVRQGELVGFLGGRISLQRVSVPFLLAGLVGSILSLALNEGVAPITNVQAVEALSEIALGQPLTEPADNVPIRGPEGRFYFLGHLDPAANTILNVMIVEPGSAIEPQRIIVAERAQYEEQEWKLYDGSLFELSDAGVLQRSEAFFRRPYRLQAPLHRYLVDQRAEDQMTTYELRKRIELLSIGGRDTHKLSAGLHFKLTLPLASLIVVVVCLPLSLRTAQYGGAAGPVLGIVLGWLYWNSLWWAKKFALGGALSPLVAAWLPNLLFAAIGVWLLRRSG